ncbi:MAG: HEAT repeat domain-containing protein [Desulfobulbaceae bacterium]|nr:HEAT repeat domain-containing protein [Desulfobulbaceae bacterium]
MKNKTKFKNKPWCPFCGMDVGRARDAEQRKLDEFPVGNCECGAVYVCDATGHNVGSAMVECLVHACNDWDLAWELLPEDDYLTGRIDNYDDVTHQVVETRNLDGRAVRGVLYFVRLHKDIAEISERVTKGKSSGVQRRGEEKPSSVKLEPLDPKRKKKRTNKQEVKDLAARDAVDELVMLCYDDKRTLRFLQRLLYAPDKAERYRLAGLLGKVCASVADREPGQVADLLHRLFEACSDSAATNWGMVETIGSVVSRRTDIYGAFARYLLNYIGDPETREAVLWGLSEVAAVRPDLIRKIPFYSTFQFLEDEDPVVRALTARLLGRIKASEVSFQLMGLQNDSTEVVIYDDGRGVTTTVADMAILAASEIHNNNQGEDKSE